MAYIIGFSGYAGSGKDTAGLALAKLGMEKRSFADPLRETCSIITGVSVDIFNDPVLKNVPRHELNGKTPREVLQLIGTEGWRNLIDKDTWVNNFIRYANQSVAPAVYTCDVRFVNEAKVIKDAGGILIHIDRPGKDKPEFMHQSELEIDLVKHMADAIIINDSTVEELQNVVVDLFTDRKNSIKSIQYISRLKILTD